MMLPVAINLTQGHSVPTDYTHFHTTEATCVYLHWQRHCWANVSQSDEVSHFNSVQDLLNVRIAKQQRIFTHRGQFFFCIFPACFREFGTFGYSLFRSVDVCGYQDSTMSQFCCVVPLQQLIPFTHRLPPISGAGQQWLSIMPLFLTDQRRATGLNWVCFRL